MASIALSYWYKNFKRRTFTFDDVTGVITLSAEGSTVDFSQAVLDQGDIIYQDANWYVRVQAPNPYAFVASKTCTLPGITSVVITPTGSTCTITVNTTGSTACRFILDDGSLMMTASNYPNPNQNVRTGMPVGRYLIITYNTSGGTDTCVAWGLYSATPDLAATATKTNETSAPADDGTITVDVSNGSGHYKVDWLWDATFINLNSGSNPQSAQRVSLPAGTYNLKVTDLVTALFLNFTLTITEPTISVTPVSGSFFYAPKTQSLTFVEEVVPDGCTIFETPDNTLLCKQNQADFTKKPYYQKVAICDSFPVQFLSDYESGEVTILNYADNSVYSTIPAVKVIANVGQTALYQITLRNHGSGKTRVYFNTGSLPIVLSVGNTFQIVNNLDGFNGNYEIIQILTDIALNSQYLVINKNYAIGAPTSTASGVFLANNLNYNVWEAYLNWAAIPAGKYFVKIRAYTGVVNRIGVSEPIDLQVSHPKTLLFKFRNFDNFCDINYQTGIISRLRVEGRLFIPKMGGTRTVLRNTTGKLRKLVAKPQERYILEFFQLPVYLHRKLAYAFDHDFFSINNVEFQTDEGYSDPSYITRFYLMNATVVVEKVDLFQNYNGTDLGADGEAGLLRISEGGFLKVN